MRKISVVIPCFNDGQFVEKAVASALGQRNVSVEVILVDDGSNTETKEVLKKITPKIDKLIVKGNGGASSARNEGIRNATGDLIAVLDADDYFEPDFCFKGAEVLDSEENIKLITCYTRRFSEDTTSDVLTPVEGDLKDFLQYNRAMGSVLFRKKDWELVGGYDEKMTAGFEDWEFYIRLLAETGRSYVIPEVLFNYRKRAGSMTTEANKEKQRLYKYIFLKNKDLFIKHYDAIIDHFLERITILENTERKLLAKKELKIGETILAPLRKLKRIFR